MLTTEGLAGAISTRMWTVVVGQAIQLCDSHTANERSKRAFEQDKLRNQAEFEHQKDIHERRLNREEK